MCRLIHRLGFKGKYIIYDLPSQSALQTFFLKTQDILLHPTIESFEREKTGVITLCERILLERALQTRSVSSGSLFIATWSLSEAPLSCRNSWLSLVEGFEFYFVAYQSRFREADNVLFFDQWKDRIADIHWVSIPLKHLAENFYLFGSRASSVSAIPR